MSDPTTNILFSLSSALEGAVAKVRPAIVSVHSRRSRASGFVWKAGLVVTADEALAEEGDIAVKLADGTTRTATIAGRDHTTDVALLRVDSAGLAPVTLASHVPALGALASVVAAENGNPTAALGAVSLVGERWRSLRGGDIDARIELDVTLRHRHEGGLALNASGEAFGGRARPAARARDSVGHHRTRRGQARGARPCCARLSRPRSAAGQARRRRRRHGDERRSQRTIGRSRHQAGRRDRRLE